MTNPTCSNCVFYIPQDNDQLGFCRNEPPRLMFAPIQKANLAGGQTIEWLTASASPPVLNGAWCGQHQPAPMKLALTS
jgi:hypothetical protein